MLIAALPNGSYVWVRIVDEVSGVAFKQQITTDLPADTQFLSLRQFMNNSVAVAAVAYDCAEVYLDMDL